ncbi:MAG: hypothetical protein KDA24_06670 [Deltaproteobacteria bacterium]|nr:hypothetical protein [Deltaproteobacteria bacterium]
MIARTMTPSSLGTTSLFQETQVFLQNGIVRLVLGLSALFSLGVVSYATVAEDASMLVLFWTAAGIVLVSFLVGGMGIVTEVASDGVRVNLRPFPGRTYAWSEIARAEVRTYRPIMEYGGWGLRWGPSGKAYNVYGTEGVQLTLTNDKRVLIGSQRAAELAAVIEAHIR